MGIVQIPDCHVWLPKGSLCLNENPISFQDEHPEIVEVLPIQHQRPKPRSHCQLPTATLKTASNFKTGQPSMRTWFHPRNKKTKRWGFLKLHSLKPSETNSSSCLEPSPSGVNDPSCRPPLACWQNRTSADFLWRCGTHEPPGSSQQNSWIPSWFEDVHSSKIWKIIRIHQVFTHQIFRWCQVAFTTCRIQPGGPGWSSWDDGMEIEDLKTPNQLTFTHLFLGQSYRPRAQPWTAVKARAEHRVFVYRFESHVKSLDLGHLAAIKGDDFPINTMIPGFGRTGFGSWSNLARYVYTGHRKSTRTHMATWPHSKHVLCKVRGLNLAFFLLSKMGDTSINFVTSSIGNLW